MTEKDMCNLIYNIYIVVICFFTDTLNELFDKCI